MAKCVCIGEGTLLAPRLDIVSSHATRNTQYLFLASSYKIIATQQETFGLKSDETCKGGQQCILELMLEWRQFLKYVHRQIVHCRDSGLGSN